MRSRTLWNIAALPGGILLLLSLGYYALILRRTMHPEAYYYHTLNINTETLTAEFADPIPGREPPREDYYTSFRSGYVLSMYHYDETKNLPYRIRYNAFHAEHNTRLLNRVKLQELSSGPYGTVYAQTTFTYRDFLGDCRGSRLDVMLYANNAEHEPAQVADDSPRLPAQLSAISLVRILRMYPEYAVVTVVYDRHGNMQRACFFGSKGGDWFQKSDTEISKAHSTLSAKLPAAEERYGIPHRFPAADYLKRHLLEWKDTGKPNPSNIINLHYDYNRWVRQDVFDASGKRTTRYLTYVLTPEDKTLEPIDWELPFGQFKRK